MDYRIACRWCKYCQRIDDTKYYCSVRDRTLMRLSVVKTRNICRGCQYDFQTTDAVTGMQYDEWERKIKNRHIKTKGVVEEVPCFRCGKMIPYSAKNIYCDECREAGRAEDNEKIARALDDSDILYGVYRRACEQVYKEYRALLKRLMKAHKKDKWDLYSIWQRKDEMEYYFFGKDFARINVDDEDPVKLIDRLQKDAGFREEDYERPE